MAELYWDPSSQLLYIRIHVIIKRIVQGSNVPHKRTCKFTIDCKILQSIQSHILEMFNQMQPTSPEYFSNSRPRIVTIPSKVFILSIVAFSVEGKGATTELVAPAPDDSPSAVAPTKEPSAIEREVSPAEALESPA